MAPPTFVFFVNEPDLVHFAYERYLENTLRGAYAFRGTTIRLRFRPRKPEDEDPQALRARAGDAEAILGLPLPPARTTGGRRTA